MIKYALILVFGAWCLQQLPVLPHWAWCLALLPFVFLAIHNSNFGRQWQAFARLILAFGVGFCWAMVCAHMRLADALPVEWQQKNIQVQGVIVSMPQYTERGTRWLFKVEKVLTKAAAGAPLNVPQYIALAHFVKTPPQLAPQGFVMQAIEAKPTNQAKPTIQANQESQANLLSQASIPHYHAGERWRLTVRLKRPHTTYNPHGFDFEAWALERNIRATGYVKDSQSNQNLNQRLNAFVWSPATVIEAAREKIAARMQRTLVGKPYLPVLQALAIGDDEGIALKDWQVFLYTGTNHLMSISGLHITMLSGLMFALVQAVWRRHERLTLFMPARKAATLSGLVVALIYALLAGFSVPTQRTLYMLAVFAVALWLNRPIAFSKVLAYALVVVVLLDPWAVIAPGFWLSFGAVAMIAFALNARVGQVHWLKQSILTQWAVTLGLLPFLLVMFGQASVVSPVANAMAIPVISLLVVPFTLLGALLPMDWALHVAHQLIAMSMHVLTWLASLPLASWQQPAPPLWSFILAIIGVMYLLMPKGVPLRWLGYCLLLPMLSLNPKPPAFGAMRVTVLDVGQGLATVIQTQNHRLLYDTGAQYSSESDAGGRVVLPFLRGEGIRKLDGMILSHNDNDHTGGAASILAQLPSSWLLSSFAEQTPYIQGVMNSPCYAGQAWQWDGVQFEIIYPSLESYQLSTLNDNNRSCVLKVSSAFGSILLTGDIEKEAEQLILDSHSAELLSVDALVVPHHGSKTSSTPAFVEAVAPTMAIATTGYLNRFKHPKQEVVARYEAQGASHYQTDKSGAVMIDFAYSKAIEISQWRGVRQRYWHDLFEAK